MDFDTIKDTFSSYTNKEEQSIDKYGSMGKCQRTLSKVKKVTFGMIPLIGHSGKGKTIRIEVGSGVASGCIWKEGFDYKV